MIKVISIASLLLAGCAGNSAHEACIDGALYWRPTTDYPWRMYDGAPAHSGFTPIPCKAAGAEGK